MIVTIIVLLILAGVSIATLTGENGLINRTTTAKQTNERSAAEEVVKLEVMASYDDLGKVDFNSFKENVKKNLEYDISETAFPATVEVDGYRFTVLASGRVSLKDGTEDVRTIQVGDYVAYDPTDGATITSITSTEEQNGYGEQIFNLSTYKNNGYGWRVLSTDGGTIKLISDEFFGPDSGGANSTYNKTYFFLRGQVGYANGVNELNRICAMYGQGKHAEKAECVTVDDINKITGYNAETASYGDGQIWEYGNDVTYKKNADGKIEYSDTLNSKSGTCYYSTFKYYDWENKEWKELSGSGDSVTLKSTTYYYRPNSLSSSITLDTNGLTNDLNFDTPFEVLFGKYKVSQESDGPRITFIDENEPQNYWLASPYVDAIEDYARYGLRGVRNASVGNDSNLCTSVENSNNGAYGVRAVVSLKSGVQLEYNETKQEWEFKD